MREIFDLCKPRYPVMIDNRKLSAASRDIASSEFLEQFVSCGFALAKIPESTQQSIRAAFCAGDDFFKESLNDKLLSQLPLDLGYRPYGVEYSQSYLHPDEVESFSVGRGCKEPDPKSLSTSASLLHKRMVSLFDLLEPTIEQFVTALAARLTENLAKEHFHGAFRQWSLLQLNYSRPAATASEYINDEHEDGCLITVMTATTPGLELKTSAGFLSVMPSPDEIAIISGEILCLLSGGRIKPTYHRVRPISGYASRMSLLFFADMSPENCNPWIANNVNKNVDIGNLVLKNANRFGLTEWSKD